ncbi:MFS transporter [Nocardia speluncae]|uniref:MFS transporter n=1 Tax=Nocardia speluncae TaxID=419477 RepID=A0A846XFX5_9NOCA|nr:MFS transporter [Nocardia speluncae]NKY33586.1 MFS transporter [Nocardia speluncae]
MTGPKATQSVRYPRIALLACCASLFLSSLDTSALVVALPSLQADLGLDVAGLQWVVVANALARGSTLFLAGSLADRYGPRRVFRVGVVVFGCASLLCFLSSGFAELILWRVLQGVGGSLMTPASISLLTGVFQDPVARSRALGTWSATAGVSTALGPVIGGVLVATVGWRSVFLLCLPFAALVVISLRWVPESPVPLRRRGIDLAGHLSIAAALFFLTFALSGGARDGWLSAPTVFALLAAAVSVAVVAGVERRAADPVLDLTVFRRPQLRGAVLTAGFSYFCLTGMNFVNALYLQQVRGYSPWEAGLMALPLTAGTLVAAHVSGRLLGRHGPRKPVLLAYGFLIAAMALLALTASTTSSIGWVLLAFALLGTGMGMANPPATSSAVAALPPERAGSASAITSTSRQVGMNLGTAALGAVTVSVAGLLARSEPADAHDFTSGMRIAYLATAAAAVLALIAAKRWFPATPNSTGIQVDDTPRKERNDDRRHEGEPAEDHQRAHGSDLHAALPGRAREGLLSRRGR